MKSFSKLEILKNKYNNEGKTLWQYLTQPKYSYIEIVLPYYDYLRGNVLLSDIKKVAETNHDIDIAQLIYLLYAQFLYQIRRGKTLNAQSNGLDLKTLGERLYTLKKTFETKNQEKLEISHYNQPMATPWSFVTDEEGEFVEKINKPQEACLTIRIKNEELYRGEILLNDLYNIDSRIDFGVEELMSYLYEDFIKKIKQEGNDERVMKSIVAAFEYYKRDL